MIEIKDLHIAVGEKQILNGVDMKFKLGKNYCLLGRNGSGKSSLSSFLMGNPKYEYVSGEVYLTPNPSNPHSTPLPKGEGKNTPLLTPPFSGEGDTLNLLDLSPDERSKQGIFLSFQNVPEIEGIKLGEFLRTIYNIHLKNKNESTPDISPFIFKRHIQKYLEELKIDSSFLERDLNVGFSGGEKRKIEILQMKLIGPKYIILDEIDSGLDLDAFKKVCKMLKKLNSETNTFIIITHYFEILNYIDIDKVYILENGKVVKKGKKNLVEEIKEKGYEG